MVMVRSRTAFGLGIVLGGILTIMGSTAFNLWNWVDGLEITDRFEVIERAYVQCGMGRTSDLTPQEPLLFGSTVWKGHVCGDGELIIVCKSGSELNAGYVSGGPGSSFAVDMRCEHVVWL